jgi:flavin-dependent dehydrogenase
VDVAVVGAGPAGAAIAILLARSGIEVTLLERSPSWHWRACGVFASPATLKPLARLGLDGPSLSTAIRPIRAMRVEPNGGPAFRLTYGRRGQDDPSPIGFDRSRLDPALVEEARRLGADVREGVTVSGIGRDHDGMTVRLHDGSIRARIVVGADGIRSTVARSLGVARPARITRRIGLSYHVADPRPDEVRDARMRIIDDGYVGFAPVRGRINVGIVLGESWRPELRRVGAAAVASAIVRSTPPILDDPAEWRDNPPVDPIAGASPVGHRVTRRSGPGWLLIGDAAGFLDPFTGEGLHRAFVTAGLGARAVAAVLGGRPEALDDYARDVGRRFDGKDVVTMLVQGFLASPPLFGYAARRLATRASVRETMGLVIGDLAPASRALDPRFLAALLAP